MANITEAIKARTALQTLGVTITAPGGLGPTNVFVSTEVLAAATTGIEAFYQPGLIGISSIVSDGAAGVPSANTEIRFEIANKVMVDLTDGPQELCTSIRTAYWAGATVQAHLYVRHPNEATWYNLLLFNGILRSTRITNRGVEIRAASIDKEKVMVPNKQVMNDSMVYGGLEGVRPDGYVGSVAPIGLGWFHPAAIDPVYEQSVIWVPWGKDQGSVLAPAVGVKIPMLPVTVLADRFQAKDATTPLTDGKFVLLAVGDLADIGTPDKSIRMLKPGLREFVGSGDADPRFPQELFAKSNTAEQIYWNRLFTWNKQLDVAMPFCKDQSDDMNAAPKTAEKPFASMGDWTDQVGDLAHTAETSEASKVQALYVARTDPDWGGAVPTWWSGTLQSIAMLPERLSQVAGVTAGIPFGTTAGVTNPLNALDSDLTNYAQFNAADRISIQMPVVGPSLGEVVAVRVVFVTEANLSHDIRVAYRHHPNAIAPLQAEHNCDDNSTLPAIPVNQLSLDYYPGAPGGADIRDCWGSGWVWKRQGQALGHGVPQWQFYEFDATVPPGQSYAPDVVVWSGDGATVKLYRIWLDVVFRPNNLNAVIRRLPGTSGGEVRSGGYDLYGRRINPAFGGHGRAVGQTKRWVPYSGNILDPELKDMGQLQAYMTGQGIEDPTNRWGYSSSIARPLTHPAGFAAFLIDKYLDDYNNIEQTPGAFGNFEDATALLDARINGLDQDWRLTLWQDKRVSMRRLLAMLGEHCMGFFTRQASGSGYRWRMFVDTDAPDVDTPERLWRSDVYAIHPDDVLVGSAVCDLTSVEDIRNSFVLRYGFHEPSQRYSYEKVLTATVTDLATQASNYKAACAESQANYGQAGLPLIQDEVLELPWCWRHEVADEILKWHANIKMFRRAVVGMTGFLNLVDIQVGMYVRLDDEMEDVLGPYAGLEGGVGWDGRYWQVVSRGVRYAQSGHILVDLSLVEVYSIPPIPLP